LGLRPNPRNPQPFFAFGEKIEELDSRASLSQHLFFQQINMGLELRLNPHNPSSFLPLAKK
jgi:hypothetical protein